VREIRATKWAASRSCRRRGRFRGAEAHAGPVGRLLRIGEGIAVADEGVDDLVDEVRMAAAVAGALHEAAVRLFAGAFAAVHAAGGEDLDGLGRRLAKSGVLTSFGIFGSGSLAVWRTRGSCSMSGHSTLALLP